MINREIIRLKVLQLTYAFYQNSGKTIDAAERELFYSIQKSHDLYKMLLLLIVDVTKEARRRYEIEYNRAKRENIQLPNARFINNRFVVQLAENKTLLDFKIDQSNNWDADYDLINKLCTLITTSEFYHKYVTESEDTYEVDRDFWRKAYKYFMTDNDDIDEVLENRCIFWNDDKYIIDTFIDKTIKKFNIDNGVDQPLLKDYADADDEEFAHTLFRNAIKNSKEYQEYMMRTAKNWDFNRLAYMDIVIMQIAIAEMLSFPNIPINVTISLYVDLAKLYSTSNSWKFVNGMLDEIAHILVNEHRMLKQLKNKDQN